MKKLIIPLILFGFLSCNNAPNTKDQQPILKNDTEEYSPDVDLEDVVTVFTALERDPNYNSVLKLMNQAQLIDAIKNLDDVTFFAPTNAAVNRLPEGTYDDLRLPENLEKLQSILKYHIAQGNYDSEFLKTTIKDQGKPFRVETLNAGFLSISINGENLIVTDENANQVKITEPNIKTSNGIIHGIENVLMPVENKL